jgi:hypothetical protein
MKTRSLISAVEGVLEQGRALLRTISNEDYTRTEDGPYGASIGAHYRHVLDHFLCLIEGLWDGEINYDERARSPELEGSIEAALRATEELIEAFRALPAPILQQECTVTYSVGYGEAEAQAVRSVVAREVMFCVGHAIHHYAILKLLCAERTVALPYEFGIAPSTLKHLEAQAAQ